MAPEAEGTRGAPRPPPVWQPGGGYDRNIVEPATLRAAIDDIHANPVRRGLVDRPEAWPWSSAAWYDAGDRPVAMAMDRTLPDL